MEVVQVVEDPEGQGGLEVLREDSEVQEVVQVVPEVEDWEGHREEVQGGHQEEVREDREVLGVPADSSCPGAGCLGNRGPRAQRY